MTNYYGIGVVSVGRHWRRGLLFLVGLFSGVEAFACKPEITWNDSISFCAGNSITLDAYNVNSTYYWSTGATTSSITISSSGTYWVTVTNPCGSTKDTIHVSADQPVFPNLGSNRSVCSASNPILSVPYDPFYTYKWQDGSSSHQYPVTQSGTYWVEVSNACGTFRDTVQLTVEDPPNVNLGPDINDCTPTVHSFSVSPAAGTAVKWSTGSTNNNISVSQPGTYWVKLTNACGSFYDTVKITLNQGHNLNLGDTIYKCANGIAMLIPNVSGGSYQWSTGAVSSSITVQSPGLYWLQYTDPCGTFSDSVYVANTGKAKVDLGPDTAICKGDVLMLDAGNPGSVYTWQDNSNNRRLKVDTVSATYWVGVNNGCGFSYDTINISIKPLPRPGLDDTVFYCVGSSVNIDMGDWGPTTSYLWDNASTSRMRNFSVPGSHWVEVGNDCDTVHLDFEIDSIHPTSLNLRDTVLCDTEFTIETNIPSAGHDFLWSTGKTGSSIKVSSSGQYSVQVANACDTITESIDVQLLGIPEKILNSKVTMCAGSPVTIGPAKTPLTSYQWNTGDTTRKITVTQPGEYTMVASNLCDTVYDTVDVVNVFPLNLDLGPDTTFCEPDVLYLDATGYQADSLLWSTGSRNAGLPVTKSGTYWLKAYNVCGVYTDTIHVQVDPLPEQKLNNRAICIGDTAILDVSQSQVQNYQWSTGASGPSIAVTQNGWYYVDMVNHCGTVRDSAFVRVDQPIPQFSLGNDTVFCQGTLLLDPGNIGGATYSWQNGSTSRTYLVDKSGTYYVTATNTCNSITDTIDVLITGPPKLVLGEKITFCHGATLTLNAQNPGSTYIWNTGDSTQTLEVDSSGVFWVTITNDCGQLTDTVRVIVEYPLDQLELGEDTVICRGEQLILDTEYPGEKTIWSTGATSQTITVTETGTYAVELRNSCGKWSDSIFVEVLDVPVFSLGKDSVICAIDGQFPISGPPGPYSYLWSNGDTNRATILTTHGFHWLRVSNKCFSYTDTIYLKDEYPIEMDLGEDKVICFGQSLNLNPGNTSYQVSWNNNKTGPELEVTRRGTYWATARNSCGLFGDTIKVQVHYHLDDRPVDTVVCDGDPALFDMSEHHYKVVWGDGKTDSIRRFEEEGSYPFTIYNKCGAFPKEFIVEHSNCDCPLYVPDAFTPNKDGLNDEFRVMHDCPISDFHLKIFNRWGEMVYSNDDVEEGWDGTFNGKQASIGTYNYILEYSWEVYGVDRTREKRGHITLLR